MAKSAAERQRERRAQGLCGSCNNKALPGKWACQECSDRASARARERYQARKSAAICASCHDPAKTIVAGKTCCKECLEQHAERSAAYRAGYTPKVAAAKREDYDNNVARGVCVVCGKRKATDGRVDCDECSATRRAQQKVLWRKRRVAVLTHYGARCVCCGESEEAFLEIDHIDNNGAAHRKEVGTGSMYKWLIANSFPAGFQVLCSNCNHAKGRYGICPHEAARRRAAAT